MTFAAIGKMSIPNQRGFWLRCFLSGTVWVLLCIAGSGSLKAQLDLPGPERLSHVEGLIVNDTGHPVVDLEVTLLRDEKVAFQTRTDKSGGFGFQHVPSGAYLFRVKRTANSPAERQIVITDEVVTALERKKLYVILGPGACQDACSSVVTSKKDFDRAIREKNKH
ncbi:MAG TPA: carboxypeptidase-like regulatory domain-containing protein [Terracidiphilus sp.]|jgi:hypothetical protein